MLNRGNKLKIIPLGGVGEIGKNMAVLEYKNDIIVVDCGLTFPDEDMLGIDIVIPDITYLEKNQKKIKGIVLTQLKTMEAELEAKLESLRTMEVKMQNLIKSAEDMQDEKMQHLVNVYSNMKPKQAAQVLENLEESIAVKSSRSEERRVGKECRSRWSPYH